MRKPIRHPLMGAAATLCAAVALTPATAAATTTGNLLQNGDAETHLCTDDWTAQTPIPGWQVVRGAASVVCWSAFGYMNEVPALPPNGAPGNALFAAPGADTAMEQVVDVSAAARAIDQGGVSFALSSWLGGWRNAPEQAVLTAIFLDDQSHAAAAPVVVAGAGPAARQHVTAMVERSERGAVPPGTRRIAVTVDFLSGMSSFQNAYADNLRLTLSGDVDALAAAPAAAPPPSSVPPLDHVYIVMMDGHSATIDARMPFLASAARKGVLLTDMWATYHPSDQNYVAMVAGNTYRYGPVYYPNYDLPVTHLGDLLGARGRTWRGYVQNMNTPCNLQADTNGGWFAPDDEPFAQFDDVISDAVRCQATLRDVTDFESAIATNTLPTFAWIAADGWWDGEGAWYDNFDMGVSLQRQDQFLVSTFDPLLASDAWKHSRSLLVITWDESLGWGWPDNHVATVLVGSPGLLREGSVDRTHYDGYSVLRTVEGALALEGLDRFDRFAAPLNSVFRGRSEQDGQAAQAARYRAANPLPAPLLATRGSIADTFGQFAVPAAAEHGQSIRLVAPAGADAGAAAAAVIVAPLGHMPNAESTRHGFDASGIATVPTEQLSPGFYGAWLVQDANAPVRAPVPLRVLPAAQVGPRSPGVEIVDAPRSHGDASMTSVREGANMLVRYCRPGAAAPGDTWIGVFPDGTTGDQLTQANALAIGYWLKTPGDGSGSACGEAMASASELAPNALYDVYLLTNTGAAGVPIGLSATFVVTPALPH
jgi:hypothetical protein